MSKTFGPLKNGLLPPRCSRGLNCASDEATTARRAASVAPFIFECEFRESANDYLRRNKTTYLHIWLHRFIRPYEFGYLHRFYLIASPVTISLAAWRLRLRTTLCDHWASAARIVVSHTDTSCPSFSGPLQCRSQLQRYQVGSHVGDLWYGGMVWSAGESDCSWPVSRLSVFLLAF